MAFAGMSPGYPDGIGPFTQCRQEKFRTHSARAGNPDHPDIGRIFHSAAPGQNGPVIIPLNKTGDNVWSVPEGAKLPDNAYKDFEAGKLYINVHSDAHPGGEIRGQLVSSSMMRSESRTMPGTAGGGGY